VEKLTDFVLSLEEDSLLEIYNEILDAGITDAFGIKIKKMFKKLRNKSTGKKKKLYSALAKATGEQLDAVSTLLCDCSKETSVLWVG